MLERNKKYIIITTLLTLLPLLVGVILWDRLPDQMATHFNIHGEADDWSSKGFAVFVLPLILVGVHVICVLATLADPRKQNIQEKIFRMVLWITPLISLFVTAITYGYALGISLDITKLNMWLIGGVFVIVGNYLPKCRQNYTIGIKIPWTLADEENWNKTHRFAGWLWTVTGIVFLLMGLTGFVNVAVMITLFGVMVVVPMIYSYVYYVKHK